MLGTGMVPEDTRVLEEAKVVEVYEAARVCKNISID